MGLFLSGDNGTIDGQGAQWWEKFHKGQLKYTRPYLIEIMYSENVQISNLTLLNSPSWNIHPVYSRFSSLSFNLHLCISLGFVLHLGLNA
jgi:polygalacturonase